MIIERIICNNCGKVHKNVLTITGKVWCIRCHKQIDTEKPHQKRIRK